jgi:hypothetical protein
MVMEDAKRWLIEKGLVASDLPKAAVIHEVMGLTYLGGLWGCCYWVQPTAFIAARFSTESVNQSAMAKRMKEALEQAERKLLSWKAWVPVTEPRRLVVSLGESLFIRTATRPVMVPIKMWLTWQLILMSKVPKDP